jgi:transcriptional regulator with GAF, ATPase, and Fis domain
MSISPQSTEVGADQATERIRQIVGWMIGSAMVAVLFYSISVLALVALSGDIGLRFVLGTVVRDRIATSDYQWSPAVPELGSTVTKIGSTQIRSYPDLVQAFREIKNGQRLSVGWIDPSGRSHESQVLVRHRPFWVYASSIVWFVQEIFIFVVGARVFWKRPRDASAGIFFLICVLTFGAFMGGYHWTEIVISRPLIHVFTACAVFLPWANLHFYLVFPAELPVYTKHRRWLLRLIYGVPALEFLLLAFCINWVRYSRFLSLEDSMLAVFTLRWAALGSVIISAAVNALCVWSLYASFKRAVTKSQKGQIQWIFLASILSLPLICLVLYRAMQDTSVLGRGGAAWPMFVVSMLFTTAYAFSITRYRLLQADRLLGRGVLYLAVSLGAGLVYSLLLVLGGLLIGDRLRSGESSFEVVAAAASALVLLVVSGTLREQFHKVIDRRFYREKYKFDRAMRQIESAFENLLDRETLSQRLLRSTTEVIRADWGSVYLQDGPHEEIRLQASEGPQPEIKTLPVENALSKYLKSHEGIHLDESNTKADREMEAAKDLMIALGAELAIALESGSKLDGFLILGPKPSGLPYDAEEMAFVRALGSVAGLGLQSVEMRATLEQANRELKDKVEKITEQQRRILALQDQLIRKGVDFERSSEDLAAEATPESDLATDDSALIASSFGSMIGSSQSLRDVIRQARKVAATPSAVLVRGESGTGKELLARSIHAASPRSDKPFVAVHCASLAGSLLESELFGHVKGAFTGADRDRVGRFEQADGGTIFLDEIGDISLETQIKLLRVLQEKSFERVGSSQSIKVDVRVVAATHRDLETMIRSGQFREDLYYRLNVISLRMPALRDRREDIFTLAVHFLDQCVQKLGKSVNRISNETVELLVYYDWPGNIRELENCIERSVVMAEGDTIQPNDLPPELRQNRPHRSSSARSAIGQVGAAFTRGSSGIATRTRTIVDRNLTTGEKKRVEPPPETLDAIEQEAFEFERVQLLDALREAGGNRSQAARLLGLPRTTMLSRMKRHGLM